MGGWVRISGCLLAGAVLSAGIASPPVQARAGDGVEIRLPGLARITVRPGVTASAGESRGPRIVRPPLSGDRAIVLDSGAKGVLIDRAARRGRVALSSSYGERRHPISGDLRMHRGLDFAAPLGSHVIATADGVVTGAGWRGGYGKLVTVDHGDGVETRYGHLSAYYVAPGQVVRRGAILGAVGSTGQSTGPHLHYEVRVQGRTINPLAR